MPSVGDYACVYAYRICTSGFSFWILAWLSQTSFASPTIEPGRALLKGADAQSQRHQIHGFEVDLLSH